MHGVATRSSIPSAGSATRTARLFHTLPAEGRTSMTVYARELTGAMAEVDDGWTIEHYAPTGGLRTACARVRPLARLAGWADRYAAYQWAVRGQDADVNHLVDHGYGHLAFSLAPRRTVVTFHDAMLLKMGARELPTDCYPRITMLGHQMSLRAIARVARVIADSESARRDFLRFTDYPPEHVRVVPLGVSARFQPPPPSADRRGGPVRILHVGHCGPYKNVETILHALPLIAERLGEPARLVKVGGPFTESQRRLISRLRLDRQVQYLGAVPLADLPATYADADLLLQPSLYEGFGLTPLEAMACGTPVVVSDAGSLPEVVSDAGVTVAPTDVEGIADAVARVVTDVGLRATLRQRGLDRARGFTWERTALATLAVYREIYEENR
jgi:glycosyltransferase involved in cell wall biosynthesis